jgi:hypothetical protein
MGKQNKTKAWREKPHHNPVAKFACRFNKAQVYADKRIYRRTAKHRGTEPFLSAYVLSA